MWSVKRILQGAAFLLAGLLGACMNSESGKIYLEIQVDSTWFSYDSIWIVVTDPTSGDKDTVFRGEVKSAEDLRRIPVPEYRGQEIKVDIIGFRDGRPARQEQRSFDGNGTTDKKPVNPYQGKSLRLTPDSLTLYLGGEKDTLSANPAADWAGINLSWLSRDSSKARVSAGEVTPRGEGATFVVAYVSDSLKDSVLVRVKRDAPVIAAGPDTAVRVNVSLSFGVKATQEYGFIETFAWDLDGDGRYEDSAGPFPSTRIEFRTEETQYTNAGEITARFKMRDGEGNTSTATRKVKVSSHVPVIDSLSGAKTASVGDSVSFAARVSMSGGGTLARYAWDYDGNGRSDDSGSLSGSSARITGYFRYPSNGVFTATLIITDSAGLAVTGEIPVTIKASPANAYLASLSLSTGSLTPLFARETLAYRSLVSDGERDASVFALAESEAATVSINGAPASTGGASANLVLHEGTNLIEIRILAEDGNTERIYEIAVTVPPNGEVLP